MPGAVSATRTPLLKRDQLIGYRGCFDVRLLQPKLGWDADSVRKLSPDLQRSSY